MFVECEFSFETNTAALIFCEFGMKIKNVRGIEFI